MEQIPPEHEVEHFELWKHINDLRTRVVALEERAKEIQAPAISFSSNPPGYLLA